MRVRAAFLALIAIVGASAGASAETPNPSPVSADSGSIGLRLVDVPDDTRDDPRAKLYIVDHLAPGTRIRRRIEVSNTTAGPAHVILYPAAATIEDGSFRAADAHAPNELSSWTSVDTEASDVAAGGKLTATVTITVPHDAAPGETFGAVWAEVRATPTDGGGVVQVNRVGIRLYISVGPGGPPAADFTIDSLIAKRSPDGLPTVLASVHNTGGRALDLNGTLQLSGGPAGLRAGPFPANLGTSLAIGDTKPVTIVLDERLPAGPWDAQITLRSGLLERSARGTITFPTSGESPSVKTTPIRPRWLYPAAGGIGGMLTIAGVFVVTRRLRRRLTKALAPAR